LHLLVLFSVHGTIKLVQVKIIALLSFDFLLELLESFLPLQGVKSSEQIALPFGFCGLCYCVEWSWKLLAYARFHLTPSLPELFFLLLLLLLLLLLKLLLQLWLRRLVFDGLNLA
jgi:hypothetical protein